MDWYRGFMLVLGIFAAATFPVLVWKAIRDKQWHRVFDIVISDLVVACLVVDVVTPEWAQREGTVPKGLVLLVFLLFLANIFGLSRWLFKVGNTSAPHDGASG